MTLALALIAVVVVAVYVLVPQWWYRTMGYGDDRDPRWTRKLADKRLDALPPLDGDPLDEGWGKL